MEWCLGSCWAGAHLLAISCLGLLMLAGMCACVWCLGSSWAGAAYLDILACALEIAFIATWSRLRLRMRESTCG